MKTGLLILILIAFNFDHTFAQSDWVIFSFLAKPSVYQCHPSGDCIACYSKIRPISFVTQVPKTIVLFAKDTFSKRTLPWLSATALSTMVLIRFDQDISNGTQQLSKDMGFSNSVTTKNVIGLKIGSTYVPVYQAPQNVNTAMYSLGDGLTSVVISGGMLLYGKVKNDYRSLQTASQIIQAQLTVGLVTQTLKRISGRESPRVSTESGGDWKPLVSFSSFQKNRSHYDAFPSGHLASVMATVTVVSMNYPEKKWIKPVGYALTAIVGLAMVNNGVHWSGDYPVALGIGYLCGKATVNMNRFLNYSGHGRARHFR